LYFAIRSIIRSTIRLVAMWPQTRSSITQMFMSSSTPTTIRQVLSRAWLSDTAWSLAA
jgi:hypothetical protein